VSIEDTSNARVSIGDYSGNNNSTYIYLRDPTTQLQLTNPYGVIEIGDPNAIDTGSYIYYEAAAGTLYGNGNSNINDFNNIQAATFTETSNAIRVTNNARSWFL
jgi:hypothetical protein